MLYQPGITPQNGSNLVAVLSRAASGASRRDRRAARSSAQILDAARRGAR